MSKLPQSLRRYSTWLVLVGIYLVLGTLGRIVLWASFGPDADVGLGRLPYVIGAGIVNDFVQALYLFAPLMLYTLLVPDRWYRSKANRWLMYLATVATIVGLLYLTVAEWFFFEEFDARFNIVAYDYLAYPTEVFTDIWDAYPVVKVLAVAVTVALIAAWFLRGAIGRGFADSVRLRERLVPFVPYAAALGLAIAFYPTNALSVSENRVENELVQNGHSSFFRAARTSDIDYEAYYASSDEARNLAVLQQQLAADGAKFTELNLGKVNRRHAARPDGLGRLNIVVVSSESFGAEFSKLHGSDKDWMPNFDAYAKQGLWFANTYASGTRTVRGLEAISASFPPIPTVSILRRPGNQGIGGWGKVMNDLGYHSSFLYGGYGYFDDMNSYFGGNGYQVLDRTDIKKQVRFENVWGVADEDLFDLAMDTFDAQYKAGKPFFSIVMTTSNHKPFTFRPGLEQYGIKPEHGGRQSGVRYADYALGYFLREAAKRPWFDDTLFVVVADHGARVYGKAEIPLETYEIPLMFYAPKHLKSRQIDTLMSQIDIAPTVLGLLGLPYEAPFFGVDALNLPPDAHRVALFSHNHDVAILRDNELAVLGLNKTVESMDYDPVAKTFKPRSPDAGLAALGIAYFQTGADLFKTGRYK